MKIKSIKSVGIRPVYDISVSGVEHYILENGVVTHNTGVYYSADSIFIIGRQQEKDGSDLVGFNFILNVEKSRFSREKSKIPVTVYHKGGISKWSGLMDMALQSGHVIKPSNGWYQKVDKSTGEIDPKKYRLSDTDNKDFWNSILTDTTFHEWVSTTYQVSSGSILTDEDIDEEMEQV
jgi:hypothetical protein